TGLAALARRPHAARGAAAAGNHAGLGIVVAAAVAGAGHGAGSGPGRWHPARHRPAPGCAGRAAWPGGAVAARAQARSGAVAARRRSGLRPRPRHPAQHAPPRSPPRLCRAVVRPRARGASDRAGRHLPQIVPNAMTEIERRRRNRKMLLAIFALFFGSMLLAGLLRFSGWRPEGTKSHGELLEP